ncbi:glycolate oxidase subunit GlcE [Lichenicoccus roseus]|uniref:Glycolate oxidase subunit GlcE n=1 Tax=Lichenicoccus roseus TaxID=2683649 RepID=A0A5R9J5X6_9PROT|nr:glycolate oxidase subunit GlcE [Lichenicoccus roseus]TLU73020.1 glycolate oxidase subunit GlcE [Lichenicoccus roseus]
MTSFRPTSAAEVAEIVTWAAAERQPLEIVGGGSKCGLGRANRPEHRLEVAALSGILDYEPPELVLTAQAATPMRAIAAALDAERQMLAFEPPDWSALLGTSGSEPTLGGVVATNLAGPRRVRAGAARDHFLGFAAVNGRGEAWKAGGKVVKNVTGYDLCKLQAGAYGTLSVLTELSVRVLPRPEQECSVLLAGLEDEAAIRAMAAALNTPHEVSSVAHLPAAVAARVAGPAGAGGSLTVLRLEGPGPSVAYRAEALQAEALRQGRECHLLDHASSTAVWAAIGAVQPLLARTDSVVWRVCPTPASAASVLHAIQAARIGAEGFYDWGGGLLWVSLAPDQAGDDCGAAIVRGAVAAAGGHAMLLRAPDPARASVPVFQPEPASLRALAQRVKSGFDPVGILNPGRMQEGV